MCDSIDWLWVDEWTGLAWIDIDLAMVVLVALGLVWHWSLLRLAWFGIAWLVIDGVAVANLLETKTTVSRFSLSTISRQPSNTTQTSRYL